MELLARLRRQNSATPPVVWRPLGGDPCAVPAYLAGDPGCATDEVYETRFYTTAALGAVITIRVCPVAIPDKEIFDVGVQYQYTVEDVPGWSYTGWTRAPWSTDCTWGTIGRAVTEARELAELLSAYGPAAGCPDVFAWDAAAFLLAPVT